MVKWGQALQVKWGCGESPRVAKPGAPVSGSMYACDYWPSPRHLPAPVHAAIARLMVNASSEHVPADERATANADEIVPAVAVVAPPLVANQEGEWVEILFWHSFDSPPIKLRRRK